MLPELQERRTRHAALLTELLSGIEAIAPLPPQPQITANTYYNFVFRYTGPVRDLFVAALEREGIPCDGRFYEPVYRSDLFYATPENCPQLEHDYSNVRCPVAERAAYEEAVWLPQFVLIGDEQDVRDVARAIKKVAASHDVLAAQDPSLAGAKGMSRSQRARFERQKNY
jgi:dTDP-4-amino-4,6-dideoxygalactose transaminase